MVEDRRGAEKVTITTREQGRGVRQMACVLCVIPARFGSTRLPGKPLEKIAGVALIVHVYNNAVSSQAFDEICVATDDERIADEVRSAGGKAEMTGRGHVSGTDRVFEAAARFPCTHVVNLQGDEPRIPGDLLREFSTTLKRIDDNYLLTVVSHATIEEKKDPAVVKAVIDRRKEALYFSRAPIPFEREEGAPCYKHTGIYGFTVQSLKRFCAFREGVLEHAERLEQLRALENGMKIRCLVYDYDAIAVDTPEDLERFRLQVAGNGYGT
ncbi:MAG: 3-deoxy-manno-octulosonate cytidylyltransferase [Chitinispirillaceae bacterium]|nr:3-deoxy-manno-octulosonate cytidylyltransferase [Chitinispirillaceae bacterium]